MIAINAIMRLQVLVFWYTPPPPLTAKRGAKKGEDVGPAVPGANFGGRGKRGNEYF